MGEHGRTAVADPTRASRLADNYHACRQHLRHIHAGPGAGAPRYACLPRRLPSPGDNGRWHGTRSADRRTWTITSSDADQRREETPSAVLYRGHPTPPDL